MEQYIGNNTAHRVVSKGYKIGNVEESKSSKGAWSALYYYNDKIISVIYSYKGSLLIADGLIVNKDDISLHTDNIERTLILLNEAE
jgi:hypothetical protein